MLKNYLLTAYKVFTRRKLFTAINLLCIVLTLVILMVVTALLEFAFFPSGVEGKSGRFLQIVTVSASSPNGQRSSHTPVGYKLYDKYFKSLPSVETAAIVSHPQTVSVYQDAQVNELLLRYADAGYWAVLDFKVLAGRVLGADDVDQGRAVAVVNASTAARLFPGQPAVGRQMDVAGKTYAVVGVVEDAMHMNALSDIWVPLTTMASSSYRHEMFGNFTVLLMGKSAADLPRIQKDVQRAAASVVFDDPTEWAPPRLYADSKLDVFARMLLGNRDSEDAGSATLLGIIGGVMLVFMLLPALNLVNLNAGRIMERSVEIGVRKAFGATSAQLVGQLVFENILLCLAGGVLGLLCAQAALWWIQAIDLIPYLNLRINLAVFGYGLLISAIFGVLSGVIPALKMARLDPVFALKGGA